MARTVGVWGIDIGNASLKALRCHADSNDESRVIADGFDYIEYPKILTQAGAEPAELIADALRQFLSRNSVRGDRVAISVSGQNGLARFIKLPPVESKKIPDIVRYEARQQIPFDLNDVIWDYQRMGGGSEEEGFALETEIGLFAMKRDQVFRALEPFRTAGIEVDFVQLTPLALYNYVAFDQLYDLPPIDEYDPEDPPPSIVVLSMGTDATDLVITNGYRVWQRSIPLGGNHFTKALTKDLKLTFAKAEHLKRNATTAEDPKAVFQAMRPVFNDLLTEIQRSLGYFTSIDRAAKIERMVTLGNAMKLPGLRRYLAQNLGFDVTRVEEFRGLGGSEVLSAPAFKDNLLCFGVCYGLSLQGMAKSTLRTNLLPKELVKDRLIREKKPWAVATAAVLLMGLSISFASFSQSLKTVDASIFGNAESRAKQADEKSKRLQNDCKASEGEFDGIDQIGKNLVGNVEGRLLWLELMQAIDNALPKDREGKRPKEIELRNELHITNLECQKIDKLEDWFAAMKKMNWYEVPRDPNAPATPPAGPVAAAPGAPAPGAPAPGVPAAATPAPVPGAPALGTPGAANAAVTPPAAPGAAPPAADPAAAGAAPAADQPAQGAPADGPSGPGWIIQLTGYHDHNSDKAGSRYGAEYVRETLLTQLCYGKVYLPSGEKDANGKPKCEWVTNKELGIGYPVLLAPERVAPVRIKDPTVKPEADGKKRRPSTMGGNAEEENTITVRRFNFVVQFCWKPAPPSERHKAKAQQQPPAGAAPGAAQQ
jgi:type IV pilus assembly protein PilM